jgi:hypothetical protein
MSVLCQKRTSSKPSGRYQLSTPIASRPLIPHDLPKIVLLIPWNEKGIARLMPRSEFLTPKQGSAANKWLFAARRNTQAYALLDSSGGKFYGTE